MVAGLAYTVPLLLVADARIDGNGKLSYQVGRDDIALPSRLLFSIVDNTDKEYSTDVRYIVNKNFSISSHYDRDMRRGAGLTLTY